jgi:hypothetical protein
MLFASSLIISAEKYTVGLGVAEVPKKLVRVGGKHESEALILTGIRRRGEKRRKQEKRGIVGQWGRGVHPPFDARP